MTQNPIPIKAICLKRYTSVLPLYILYASEPVALYTTSNEINTNSNTIAQITLSPFVLCRRLFRELCRLRASGMFTFAIIGFNSIASTGIWTLQILHRFLELRAAIFIILEKIKGCTGRTKQHHIANRSQVECR